MAINRDLTSALYLADKLIAEWKPKKGGINGVRAAEPKTPMTVAFQHVAWQCMCVAAKRGRKAREAEREANKPVYDVCGRRVEKEAVSA